MYEYYPLVVVGAIVGLFSLVLLTAYLTVKDKKQTMGFERQIGDREILGRLLALCQTVSAAVSSGGRRDAVYHRL